MAILLCGSEVEMEKFLMAKIDQMYGFQQNIKLDAIEGHAFKLQSTQ